MTDPQNQPDPKTDDGDDKAFWDKLGKFFDDRMDAGVDRALKKYAKPSDSRNGGRPSIPQQLAKLMGGPFNPVT